MGLSASGSRHSIGMVPEAVYAVTPATPEFAAVRHNSTTLELKKASISSAELRADRQLAGFRHGIRSSAGDIVSEFTAGTTAKSGAFADMLAMALMGTWNANVLKTGLLRPSVTLERYFADVGQYIRYRGCEVNTLAFSAAPGTIVTATFGMMANDADPMAEAPIAGATYDAATTSQPMNAISGTLMEGGTALGIVSAVSISLNNNMAAEPVVGSAVANRANVGKSLVTGSLTVYFVDQVMYNKFVNETISSLEFSINDGAGNSFDFLLGAIKYTGAPVPVSNDGPVTMVMPFQAGPDPVSGTNMQITRVTAA